MQNRLASVLGFMLAALVTSTSVGQSARRAAAANETVRQSARRAAAANETVRQSARRAAAANMTKANDLERPTETKTSCEPGDVSENPAGFYPSDAWPKGEVVLTFDDGPHPYATPKVLDLLKKYRLPATFFLVGRAINAKTYSLVQRMVAEGHTLGSHSYNHDVGMAVRNHGERSIEYIRGQHETTQILIELALVARSAEHFDAMFERVFQVKKGTYLPASELRKSWKRYAARHAELLAELGYTAGKRPYPVVFSRPPAGTPYVGNSGAAEKRLYTTALERLRYLNVMWHGESGDTNAERKSDVAYLTQNLRYFSRRGGILLIHDYVRKDALGPALARMADDAAIEVVPLEVAVARKFGCGSRELVEQLPEPSAGA
jgi:peptidoglycan/xylan/chitin deacetylase (PgdA/CDA1 family)